MSACLWSLTFPDGRKEYLETVSREGITWTTNPEEAFHFLSEKMIPITTVLMRFPMVEALSEKATESQKVVRASVMKWFQENEWAHL